MDDRETRLALSCALLAALTGVAVQAILLLHAATVAAGALRAAISAEIQATRADTFNDTGTFTKGLPTPAAQ
jgi:hypothetical protein